MSRPAALKPVTGVSRWWMLTSSPFFALFWVAIGWIACVSVFTPSLIALYDPTVTPRNYVKVFTDPIYYRVLRDTVVMALIGSALAVAVGYPLALHMARVRGRSRDLLMGVVVTVLLVAFIVKLYAWQIVLAEQSFVSQFLAVFTGKATLLGTKPGVILGLVYASLPYTVLSLVASIDQVPVALEEAAACFGAGPARRFLTVILPLTSPGMATALIFAIPLNLSAFLAPLLLGRGMVQMTALQIYTASASGGTGSNWPLASALSVTLLVTCVVFTVVSLRLVQRRPVRGAAG
jgi:ABC-type spermidine/putrescine transport system permease subunit I